jgi:DNA topoisomerase-1
MPESKPLIIVESPTKAKTISRFLAGDFLVESSFGHIRDLPKSKLGVDVDNNYEPTYVVPTKAKARVSQLKKLAKKSGKVYYATDEDREGEAIAWHLDQIFQHPENSARITFHEITKSAIIAALSSPKKIDYHLVDAQQARRVLDRLVGYKLSPFLWRKVARGLSAGRVQSVALRLIVEREREINSFQAQEYWSILLTVKVAQGEFVAQLVAVDNEKIEKFSITDKARAADLVGELEKCANWKISKIDKKNINRQPPAPLTTSTLQQRANRQFGFSAKQTMVLAQQLYEGIDLGERGSVGLITYMRTDSVNLADQFLATAQQAIKEKYGPECALGPRRFTAKSKLVQEAHEAIRPTDVFLYPEIVKPYLNERQFKIYDLIWRLAVASQMPAAKLEQTTIDVSGADRFLARAGGSVVVAPGYLKCLPRSLDDNLLPIVTVNESATISQISPEQHFTQPPARYSEASLIKILEEYGIGRPSTYAPIISTLMTRNYIIKERRQLKPNDIGFVVVDLLVEHFPQIVDYQFTADLEDKFDQIASGQDNWQQIIDDFYKPFNKTLNEKMNSVSRSEAAGVRELGIDPVSRKPISVRVGRFGPYVQKGSKEDLEKPTFASLSKNLSVETITLEQALELLSLPKNIGKNIDGQEIIVGIGRFGPYLKVGNKYVSIKDNDPYTIDLVAAQQIIAADKSNQAAKEIKVFSNGIKILKGRYGAYITNGVKNSKIPKDREASELTEAECDDLLARAPEKRKAFKKKLTKSQK